MKLTLTILLAASAAYAVVRVETPKQRAMRLSSPGIRLPSSLNPITNSFVGGHGPTPPVPRTNVTYEWNLSPFDPRLAQSPRPGQTNVPPYRWVTRLQGSTNHWLTSYPASSNQPYAPTNRATVPVRYPFEEFKALYGADNK